MYQTVFVSVVGAVLVLKLIFLAGSILFTIKYQDSPRASISSADTTTVSIGSYDSSVEPGPSGVSHDNSERLGQATLEDSVQRSLAEHGYSIQDTEEYNNSNFNRLNSTYPHTSLFDALMQSNDNQHYADTSF